MIAARTDCPPQDRWIEIMSGRASHSELESSLAHMDSCSACQSRIEQLSLETPFILSTYPAETACQAGLWSLLEKRSIQSPQSRQVPFDMLGPYRLIRHLGFGGMGTVYLGRHDRLHRDVAIKLLPRERIESPGWLDRFDREMITVASIENTHVVRATDAGFHDGWHYYVMEYLDGMDLGRIANRIGKLPIADACEIIRQAAIGLACIHEKGLVHRDVKPSNLMLTRQGQVKLLDLGLVLAGDDPLDIDERLTTVGHLLGTIGYMAPEQLIDSRSVDWRADLYSLGATFYRLLAGALPHPRQHGLASHVIAITTQSPKPIDSLRPDIDPKVSSLVHQLLSRDPADRPQSAIEVAKALELHSKDHQLSKLLRTAITNESMSNDESLRNPVFAASHNASQPATQRQPKTTRRWPTWVWWIGLATLGSLILAGILFKIETDRGELVIHSEYDGLTVLVKRESEVIERLEVSSTKDQRTTLRKGTYRVEIEGGGPALRLSDDVVTIGRGSQSVVNIQPSPPFQESASDLLYRGQSLAEWRRRLKLEQSTAEIGQAMRAVEVLSRETSQRREVASEVLQLARRWGGIISSGTGEQFGQQSAASDPSSESGRFMAFLLEVFPQFLPDPGFHVLLDEFQNGNERSRTACTWLLANGIQGVVGETQFPDEQSKSITWLRNEAKLQHEQMIPALLEQLQRFSETSKDKTVIGLAFSTSIPLAALKGLSIDTYPSLTRYARETIQHRYEQFKLGSNPNESMASTTPVPALLLIGLELAIADARVNEVDPKLFQYFFWELFEGSFMGIESAYVPRFEKAIAWLFQHHNDIAIGEVEQRLAMLISKAVEDTPSAAGGLGSMGTGGGGMGGMGMAADGMGGFASQQQFLELQSFDNPQSAWGLILIQYATTKQPASQGLKLLTGIRDTLTSKYTRGGMGGLRLEDSPLERSIELLSYR